MGKYSYRQRHSERSFGWPAIHTRKPGKEEPPKLENIFIDIGAKNKKEVESMGVHVAKLSPLRMNLKLSIRTNLFAEQ